MPSLSEIIPAYEAKEKSDLDVLSTLERENLYVPLSVVTMANQRIEMPVYIKLSDESECVAVFSSDTVIDRKFYHKYTWKHMSYLELEAFVLGQPRKHNVIVDPYSEHPFMLKLETIERLSAFRLANTGEDAELDTEVTAFADAIEKALVVFPMLKSVKRVWALTYRTSRIRDVLCFVLDITDEPDPDGEFRKIFDQLQQALGPAVMMIMLSYREVRAEIRGLGAKPCYIRQK